MFSRNAIEGAMTKSHLAVRQPWSLAVRMALYYAISAFLLLLLTTVLAYWALQSQLEWTDDMRLLSKMKEVRPILLNEPLHETALRQSVEVEFEARSMEPVWIRVKDMGGQLLVETPGMEKALPVGSFMARWEELKRRSDAYELKSSDGWPFRAMSAEVSSKSGKRFIVHIACDHLSETVVLEDYRDRLRNILALAILICGMTGYVLARRGLRPLAEMGKTVSQIKASTLDVRLDLTGMPTELSTLAASFNEMLVRLEDAFSRISRYSADIAHELRTPLHNLRNGAEIALARARTPEEYRDSLASCLEECQRLGKLIESLMFIARAENPATMIQREVVDVTNELNRLAEFYSASAGETGIELTVDAPEGISAQLDRQLFQRAVGNLIENAIKYSEAGSKIHLAAWVEEGQLHVEVRDEGRGIPNEHLPRVFDRFYRVDDSRAKKTGGLGLGLAIVQTIAQLHQGRTEIDSKVGVGTRVRLVIPKATIQPPTGPRLATEKSGAESQWAKPARA
jgi:two-component system heavy metal sensor histidine kinase CusS